VKHAVQFFIRKFVRALARFGRSRDGNIALTFALSLIPLLAFVGAAVDYSRANSMKASMQAALDATALMSSKNAASLTAAQVQAAAQTYFSALFTRPEAKNVIITATYSTSDGSSVVTNGSADMDTDFMTIVGFKTVTIAGTSTVKWGSARLRVALVLDTTGSVVSDGKIDALKTATKNLLTQLQLAASVNGDVYVSMIPFSKNVNLGTANFNATWIDWTDWDSEPAILKASKPSNWSITGPGDACPFTTSSHGFKCSAGPDNGGSTTSTILSSGAYAGYICPDVDTGSKDSDKIGIYYNGCYDSVPTTTTTTTTVSSGWGASCGTRSNCTCTGSGSSKVCTQTTTTVGDPQTHTWIKTAHSTWNGCVTDRGTSSAPISDYDRLVTAPNTSIPATLFPAEQNSYCSSIISGLSYNWSVMASQVDALNPLGATNQPIGLVWGWQSLVGGGPLTMPAKDSNYTYTDVIILLSDGLNTLDRWYGNGSSTSTSVDARMYDSNGKGTCANINAAGITVYAIQVNTGGDPTSTLLQNCAGSPGKFPDSSKFFLLTTADQIVTTFDSIGTKLTQLRVAK
jgi:Flp pilus assembly protein TadG